MDPDSIPHSDQPSSPEPSKSICVLAVYFGPLPFYFDAFLRSCEFNPSIQWIVLSDDGRQWDLPPNVKIRATTLTQLRTAFSEKLGFPVSLEQGHKMCDFRPAYGLLFRELLAGFDFWGHCDLDVVFGDLRLFLTNTILDAHDKILQRGHLSLYRNIPEINSHFMKSTPGAMDYRQVFQSPKSWGFDEWRGIYRIFRYLSVSQYYQEIIADIVPPSRWKETRFTMTSRPNYHCQFFYWLRGKVFQAHVNSEGGVEDTEMAYIHFQKRSFPRSAFSLRHATGFSISPNGFQPYAREHLSKDAFESLNCDRRNPTLRVLKSYYAYYSGRLLRLLSRLSNK